MRASRRGRPVRACAKIAVERNARMENEASPKPKQDPWVIHPFLWAIFPVVSVQASNFGWVQPYESVMPLCVMLGLAIGLWLVLWPVLPDRVMRGLALSAFWVPFYSYGLALDAVRKGLGFSAMAGPGVVVVAVLLAATLAAVVLWGMRRGRWRFALPLTTLLNAASVAVVGASSLSLAYGITAQHISAPPKEMPPSVVSAAGKPAGELPDIYFLIFDSFPRADYLRDYFGYDDTPFLEALRKQGFFIGDKSRSNYQRTLLSLSATLNLRYHALSLAPEGFDAEIPALFGLVRDNAASNLLKQQGYEDVVFASGVTATETVWADRLIRPATSQLTRYQQIMADLTPWRSVLNRMHKEHWHFRVPFILDHLATLERGVRPMFVFAHSMAPHMPHNYTAEGRVLDRPLPYKEGWRAVTEFLGKRIPEVTAAILARHPNSVIIIQGDHGPRTTWQTADDFTDQPWTGSWPDWIRDRSAILNAVYFPDRNYDGFLYPEITPVNVFRAVLRKYLGLDLPALPDETYLSPVSSPKVYRVDAEHPEGLLIRP